MKYQRTQVYLDPDDHRRLREEAHRRGISLAELMRQIAHAHVSETAPAHGKKSWDSITAIVTDGPPTDIANKQDEYMAEWADAQLAKFDRDYDEWKRADKKAPKRRAKASP